MYFFLYALYLILLDFDILFTLWRKLRGVTEVVANKNTVLCVFTCSITAYIAFILVAVL